MHKFFETLMFCFDIMLSQMPINMKMTFLLNMKITFLLLGTHDQRFASVTLFVEVYLLFCTMYGNIVITILVN